MRYRLSVETKVNEHVKVGSRFASGVGDPRSTNLDLSNQLSGKTIVLDRAFFELSKGETWWLAAGKFGSPFLYTDAHWDSDVNFEGGAGRWVTGEETVLSLTAAGLWLERYREGHGNGIIAAQATLAGTAGDAKWQAGAGVYSYVSKNLSAEDGDFGNSITESDHYLRDFEVLDVIVVVTLPGMKKSKWVVTLNPLLNTATSKDNTGWLAQLKWKGKVLKRATSWSYDYRTLEADAVFGAFIDSDVAGGFTDQRSHRIMADMEIIDGFTAGGTAIFSTMSSSGDGDWYQRWMLDGVVKF